MRARLADTTHPEDNEMRARPLLLGHRGARARRSIPENTFASFDQALADGCHGFEFDVRLTSDGKAVICHDEEFGRLTIARTLAKHLPDLATLEGVLQRYHNSAFLDIELKVPGLEDITLELLAKYPPRRGYVVSSFLPEVLRTLRQKNSQTSLGLICENKSQLAGWQRQPVRYLIVHHRLLTRKLIDEAKDSGKEVFVWTVNRADQMRRFANWGVEGIISDDTECLARALPDS
ncbi:MAG TPA: glycerophosphodiester phosphodiesterase [Candidatus Sulfotelmatobacter sp.]|nr:glycerophosphodiester phosphodiesterase [Candidatus Sulfotelmatobacter sp.]